MDEGTIFSVLFLMALTGGGVIYHLAKSKGIAHLGWFLFGTALFVPALVVVLLAKPDPKAVEGQKLSQGSLKKCPRCAELVKQEAVVCRFCNYEFEPVQAGAGFLDYIEQQKTER